MVLAREIILALGLAACASGRDIDRGCTSDDQDGVVGGNTTVLLTVSDTGFAVGGVNSGSTQPNIAVQNSSNVTLTLTNVGTSPHGLHIACIPTDSPAPCPALSCFPTEANIAAILPGESVTVRFATPAVEGAYLFTADEPSDAGEGEPSGSVGQFVLI